MDRVELLVGRVGRAHGLRGDTVIDVRTDEPDKRFAVGASFDTVRGRLEVRRSVWHGQRLLVGFTGVDDRTTAEALRGTELRILVRSDEQSDDPDEFYDHQLIGLLALRDDGVQVGAVTEVLHLPAQDLLVVARSTGGEVLIPFVRELVPSVDLVAGQLVVVDRPGLLEETADEPDGPPTGMDGLPDGMDGMDGTDGR